MNPKNKQKTKTPQTNLPQPKTQSLFSTSKLEAKIIVIIETESQFHCVPFAGIATTIAFAFVCPLAILPADCIGTCTTGTNTNLSPV